MPTPTPASQTPNSPTRTSTPASATPQPTIRAYRDADEEGWLRCRVLSFLHTCYYDGVKTTRRVDPQLAVSLVAIDHDEVVGLIDLTVAEDAATIDTIAVHPDHQHHGIGTSLLNAAIAPLPLTVTTLDAWTREDEDANRWYLHSGFAENFRYLHVYPSWDEIADGFSSPEELPTPPEVFAHAGMTDEAQLRRRFRRVYVCRQYLLQLETRRSSRPSCSKLTAGRPAACRPNTTSRICTH